MYAARGRPCGIISPLTDSCERYAAVHHTTRDGSAWLYMVEALLLELLAALLGVLMVLPTEPTVLDIHGRHKYHPGQESQRLVPAVLRAAGPKSELSGTPVASGIRDKLLHKLWVAKACREMRVQPEPPSSLDKSLLYEGYMTVRHCRTRLRPAAGICIAFGSLSEVRTASLRDMW